jgi:hypothetical protein
MLEMDNFHLLICPHCSGCIMVHHAELHCRIFRHGVYKNNFEQIFANKKLFNSLKNDLLKLDENRNTRYKKNDYKTPPLD